MKVALNPCYILHRRNYRETSLILEVFSHEHGRLSLVAKGARRNRSQQHYLQLYQRLNLAWSIRTEMGTMIAVEPNGDLLHLSGQRLISAFYLNELLMRMLHRHESHPELFDAYQQALEQLNEEISEQKVLRVFEKYLLYSLGYGLVLDHDVVSGDAILPERDYFYEIDHGPVLTETAASHSLKISGRALLEFDRDRLDDDASMQQVKRLMRMTLMRHLGSKPLASRELYQAYLESC